MVILSETVGNINVFWLNKSVTQGDYSYVRSIIKIEADKIDKSKKAMGYTM